MQRMKHDFCIVNIQSLKLVIIYCFYEAIKKNQIDKSAFKEILTNTYEYVKIFN